MSLYKAHKMPIHLSAPPARERSGKIGCHLSGLEHVQMNQFKKMDKTLRRRVHTATSATDTGRRTKHVLHKVQGNPKGLRMAAEREWLIQRENHRLLSKMANIMGRKEFRTGVHPSIAKEPSNEFKTMQHNSKLARQWQKSKITRENQGIMNKILSTKSANYEWKESAKNHDQVLTYMCKYPPIASVLHAPSSRATLRLNPHEKDLGQMVVEREPSPHLVKLHKELRRKLRTEAELMNFMDADRSDTVSYKEFTKGLSMAGVKGVRDSDLRALFAEFDRDGGGTIEWSELQKALQQVTIWERKQSSTLPALVGGGRIDVSPTKGKGLSSGRVPLLDVGGAGRELSSENACNVADDDAVAILSGNSRVSSVRSSGIKDSLDQAVESGRGSPTILEHSVEEEASIEEDEV